MKAPHVLLSLASLVFAAACLDVTSTGVADAQIQVVNASGQALNLFLDNRLSVDNSQQLNVSLIIAPSGSHTLTVRTAGGVESDLPITTTPGGLAYAYAYTTESGEVNLALLDTMAVPAAGKARVRAFNLSKLAGSVDVYASQPRGSAGILLAPTFDYLAKTDFTEQNAGTWEAYITDAGTTTKIETTGAFDVESGGRRTVVLIDSLSVPVFRVLAQ